jgi:hypothetical protein
MHHHRHAGKMRGSTPPISVKRRKAARGNAGDHQADGVHVRRQQDARARLGAVAALQAVQAAQRLTVSSSTSGRQASAIAVRTGVHSPKDRAARSTVSEKV